MDIICQNSNCRKPIQINGPWIPHVACAHCGRLNYSPFTYSDEFALPELSPPPPDPPKKDLDNAGGNWNAGWGQRWNPAPDPPKIIQPIATLMSEDHFGQRQDFKLKLGTNIIGRATPNLHVDIVLADNSLSRPHCVLEVLDNKAYGWKYLLYDIGCMSRKESTNGVYIALRTTRLSRMEQVELQVNDYFITGNVRFELRL
ncbi:MAG: Inner rane component of cytoplasmic domain [Bacteroidota bacterium]|jgi:hypothetical protein